ncbi:MAG: TVP38/TMEM64 family protein [Pseudomonadales bacterium]|nr:TVP38/TMEM64 family protein [Pseudomonadales bacterium]
MSSKAVNIVRIATALVVVGLLVWLLPVREWLGAALEWTAANPRLAAVSFVGLYVVATVAMLPGLLLTIAAGAIFGLVAAVALVSVASVLGATAAFFVGRTVARDWVSRKIASWPRFRALDRALGERGLLIVMLTRLSPLFPFNLLNYAYGITAVKPGQYILGSWIGMFPATLLYVYAGSVAANLTQVLAGDVDTGWAGQVLLVVGLIATVAVTVLVTRVARRYLEREVDAAGSA